MTPKHYVVLVLLALALSCDRTGAAKAVAADATTGVSKDAVLAISAPTLAELRTMSQYVEPLAVAVAGDEASPAWFACEPVVCVLRRGAKLDAVTQQEGTWRVPDGTGSLVVWGAEDRPTLDAAVARFRAGEPLPTGWGGFIEPQPLLRRWEPTKPRAKELLERVAGQAGRIDFTMTVVDRIVDAELKMRATPGEPVFINELGLPRAPLPRVTGLTVGSMLGIVRLSADPAQLWALLRSVLTVKQRASLDATTALLRSELKFDVEKQLLDTLSGQIVVFAYEPSALENPTVVDLLGLGSTHEAVLLGVNDRKTLRLALDAWTQISQAPDLKGSLTVLRATDEAQEWAWMQDGELRWSALLDDGGLLIVDSAAALDRARAWTRGENTDETTLEERGATSLFNGDARSGLYVNLAGLRAATGDLLGDLPGEAVAITLDPTDDGEVVRVRLTLAPKPD